MMVSLGVAPGIPSILEVKKMNKETSNGERESREFGMQGENIGEKIRSGERELGIGVTR